MTWLGQNWIWLIVAVGAFFFMTRMGGCGMGFSRGNRGRSGDVDGAVPPSPGNQAGMLFDPVAGHEFIASGNPLSAVYQGRAYYFESRQNRDSFEAEPERYVAQAGNMGAPVAPRETHHHHGC